MDKQQIMRELESIFQNVFQDTTLKIFPEMTANDVAAWDSLSHVEMMRQVEKHFNLRFKLREVRRLKNVGEFIELLCKKLS